MRFKDFIFIILRIFSSPRNDGFKLILVRVGGRDSRSVLLGNWVRDELEHLLDISQVSVCFYIYDRYTIIYVHMQARGTCCGPQNSQFMA